MVDVYCINYGLVAARIIRRNWPIDQALGIAARDKAGYLKEHYSYKLLDNQVEQMRDLYKNGSGLTELATKFNVCKSTVHRIVKNQSRKK